MNFHNLSVLLICFATVGCTRFEVSVTTYLSQDLPFPADTSTIAVVAQTSPGQSFLEREVTKKIEVLLWQRGYSIKPLGEADLILIAYFAIDSGNTVSGTYSVHVPGGTAYTSVYSSTGQWATATTRLPGRTEQRSYSYTFFTRCLGMKLFDRDRFIASTSEHKEDATFWQATTTSAGSSSDLRLVIDYLLVATFDHFGSDTGKEIEETLRKRDKRVRALRASARAESTAGPVK